MTGSRVLFLVTFLWAHLSIAQINRYVVHFTEKDTVTYSQMDPAEFLSQRSLARRERQSIPVTAQDFPVASDYLDSLRSLGVEVYHTSRWFNACITQMDASKATVVLQLNFVSRVEYVAPGSLLSPTQIPVTIPEVFMEPPAENANSTFQLQLLSADKMHEDGYKGEGMIIAVFDNGFTNVNKFTPLEHLFNNKRILGSRDFTTGSGNVFQHGGHGTEVLSCIAADYKQVMKGTAPEADFILCVTEASGEYRVEEYNWLFAAEYADSLGVDVINSSLGYNTFDDPSMNYDLTDMDGKTTVISRAAGIVAEKGVIVVTSAGNEGRSSSWNKITAPADAINVLSVGSINTDRSKTSFSSFGPSADGRLKPEVSTIGHPVTVMSSAGHITSNSGTSFSSPQIAGFAACIWQANRDWNYLKVIDAIKKSGSNALQPDTLRGYGVPNYELAVNAEMLSVSRLIASDITIYPNPVTGNLVTVDLKGALAEDLVVEITDLQGKKVFRQKIHNKKPLDKLEVSFEDHKAGTYILTLTSKSIQKTIKLVKI